MDARIVGVALGLLLAGAPALAQQPSKPAKPVHAVPHHAAAHGKSTHTSAVPAAYTAIPEAERLAIQSDLVWLGGYEGMSAEEFDGHTVEAIKAFQRRHSGKDTGVLSDQERAQLAEAAKAPAATVGWRLIEDSATGARLGLPEKLVPRASAARTGSRWTSAQGQIEIETFRLHEASLPVLFEDEKKTLRRHVGYSALGANSFVIAGEQKLKKFVIRAQSNGEQVRGVTVLYDQATEGTMAAVAIAVADTFQGFPDPNAGPLPGRSRGVEYGTAIVVTSTGDLLAIGEVTDRCQSITVPGFGHAERIAEDKPRNLALLRLYGARHLVPAPLSGDGSAGDQLTLFGIAGPLAGNGTVTNAAAHLTAQAIDPAPKPGFSGAPAIDGQGRFAGLVTLQAPVVAGTGAAAAPATLIPAAAVHDFLQAQRITPAAAGAAIEQSILRVICVRK